jgi:hypothetical protein
MLMLRQQNRFFRRPRVETLEDRRPVSESLRPLAAMLAAAGAAELASHSLSPSSGAASPYSVSHSDIAVTAGDSLAVGPRADHGITPLSTVHWSTSADGEMIACRDTVFAERMDVVAAPHDTAQVQPLADHTPGLADGAADGTPAGAGAAVLGVSDNTDGSFSAGPDSSAAAGGAAAGSNVSPTIPSAAAPPTAAPAASHTAPPVNVPSVFAPTAAAPVASTPVAAPSAAGATASPAAQPASSTADNSLYDAGDLLGSATNTAAPQPSDFSSNPVQYGTGIVELSFTDLPSDNSGLPTGLTRSWTNGPSYSTGNNGSGMVFTQLPHLVQLSGGSIMSVANGTNVQYFDPDGSGGYTERYFSQDSFIATPGISVTTFTDISHPHYPSSDHLYLGRRAA